MVLADTMDTFTTPTKFKPLMTATATELDRLSQGNTTIIKYGATLRLTEVKVVDRAVEEMC